MSTHQSLSEDSVNPYHKPAGHHRPIRVKSIHELTVADRFALMLGKPLSDTGKRIVDHLTGQHPHKPTDKTQ